MTQNDNVNALVKKIVDKKYKMQHFWHFVLLKAVILAMKEKITKSSSSVTLNSLQKQFSLYFNDVDALKFQ